jgi:hypothetical protein
MPMKYSSDTIWNPTRDLSACSAVPHQSAPPHVLITSCNILKLAVTFVDNSLFSRCNAVAASLSKLSIERWINGHNQELEILDTQAR